MKTTITLLTVLFSTVTSLTLGDTFGNGANTFNIDFVTIGNTTNDADGTGAPVPAGAVGYAYRIGKFEISEQMIDKANALGDLAITKEEYSDTNMPATDVNWFEAARFVNWLNTSTGNKPAYKFKLIGAALTFQLWESSDEGYDADNRFRNSQSRYFLPSADEWYKAAYYDPTKQVYYDYPTGSDTAPIAASGGAAAGTAIYGQANGSESPSDITHAGGLSPYGTMAQGGNVIEWEESVHDGANSTPNAQRGVRGGHFLDQAPALKSAARGGALPDFDGLRVGFRVASIIVPEPSTFGLLAVAAFMALRTRRRKSVPHNRV